MLIRTRLSSGRRPKVGFDEDELRYLELDITRSHTAGWLPIDVTRPTSHVPHNLSCAPHFLSYRLPSNRLARGFNLRRARPVTIGRKHKPHREQLAQAKPARNPNNQDKGRGKGRGKGKSRYSRMGQEESHVVDEDTPTKTLESRSIEAVAKYIKDGGAGRVVVMVSYKHTNQK